MITRLRARWRAPMCLCSVIFGLMLLYLCAYDVFGQIPPFNGGMTPTVQFASGIGYPVAQGSSINVGITLSAPSQTDVSVAYATSDGTATAGVDYVATSGTVLIPAGATSATFPVQTLADPNGPQTSTVNLTLSSPSGATLGTPSTSTLNLLNESCSSGQ